MRGDKGVMATCHPKRRHVSLGYCTSCYQKLYNYDREKLGHTFIAAKCHSERRAWANDFAGRCRKCWYRDYTYKLSPGEFDLILASQHGRCVACDATENLVLDHDRTCCNKRPTCGKCTRAILCQGHNRTMAFLDLPVIERESLERVKTNPWANLESVVKV